MEGEEDEVGAVARARAVAAAMKSNQAESGAASAGGDRLVAAMAELDMDHYDDSGDEGGPVGRLLGSGNPGGCSWMGCTAAPHAVGHAQPCSSKQRSNSLPPPAHPLAGNAFYRDPRADPLLGGAGSDSDSDSEGDAFRLRDDDLLVLAARNEDDVSHLEVCVWGGGAVASV